MNILEITHVRERAGIRAAIEGGAGFRGHDRAVVVDFLNDGDVAVIRVGTFLACGEHDDVADMARRVINPIAQGAGRIGPLATSRCPCGSLQADRADGGAHTPTTCTG